MTMNDIFCFQDEAFALWDKQWARLYTPDSPSHNLITSISNSYYLVSLVDNEFPKDTCLFTLVNEMLELQGQLHEPAKVAI